MTTHTGYLLIADISGYTQFLTSSEQDHANPILQSLLSSMVEQVGEPLHFWKMDGDAVLAYSTQHEFPSGETFLTICENLYNAFASRRQDIIANTTCRCQACANVSTLDLKIMAHHGRFDEMQVGPVKDISGADVIFAFFGYNESFAGAAGLDEFRGDLESYVDHVLAQQYGEDGAPRLVLFSSIPQEDASDPNRPDASRPLRITRSMSSRSTLPPDSTTTVGPGWDAIRPLSTAASPAAPDGSTRNLARSSSSATAVVISSSSTVTRASTNASRWAKTRSEGRDTAMPSASVKRGSTGVGRPAARLAT